MSAAFWNAFQYFIFYFASLMSRLAIMTITFKHLLNSSAYTLPVWAVCGDFPVVAHVSSSCYNASVSETNTHTMSWCSCTNAVYGHAECCGQAKKKGGPNSETYMEGAAGLNTPYQGVLTSGKKTGGPKHSLPGVSQVVYH